MEFKAFFTMILFCENVKRYIHLSKIKLFTAGEDRFGLKFLDVQASKYNLYILCQRLFGTETQNWQAFLSFLGAFYA